MAEHPVAQVANHPLPDIRHQILGKIRADAFGGVDDEDRDDGRNQPLARRQYAVEDRFDERRQRRRRGHVDDHRRERACQPRPVWSRIREKPVQRAHPLILSE